MHTLLSICLDKPRNRNRLVCTILFWASYCCVFGQESPQDLTTLLAPRHEPVPILFVGSYHMSNPKADMFNLEADDVLLPKRQGEIQEVADLLKKFKPTKIAVEAPKETV